MKKDGIHSGRLSLPKSGFELTAFALRIHAKGLGQAKGLLVLLCSFWGPGAEVRPGGRLLMARAGISESSLTTYIKTLEGAGLMKTTRRPNRSSLYHLNVAAIAKAASVSTEAEARWADDYGSDPPDSGEPDPPREVGSSNSGDPVPQILGGVPPNSGGGVNQLTNQMNKPGINIMAAPKIELDFSLLNMAPELVDEIKAIRKRKKAPITQRVINTLAKEFAECRVAGATDDDMMNEWDSRNWSSFKAAWFLKSWRPTGQQVGQPQRLTARQQGAIAQEQANARVLAKLTGQAQPINGGHTYEH